MKVFWILGLFCWTQFLWAQKTMQGQVIDYDTTIPIAFAKITYQNKIIYSNWEGKFALEVSDEGKPIFVYYKGYHDKSHYINVAGKTI
ncbi:MAG: hypothetical protein ACOVP9_05595, partial [Flavobacterium stagni]